RDDTPDARPYDRLSGKHNPLYVWAHSCDDGSKKCYHLQWQRALLPALKVRGLLPGFLGRLNMCGIAGWLGTLPDNERYASRMVHALRHRGPDAHGIRSWPEATLIHTRLSIIDLSPTGAQPMANADGTVWTIFNGEIYNHRELPRQLEA